MNILLIVVLFCLILIFGVTGNAIVTMNNILLEILKEINKRGKKEE